MTNGPGKSSNNTGQPVAEGTEGKGLAKGNLPQQNASRTPSRKDAPSALERVHIRYYGVPFNQTALHIFRFQVGRLWHRALSRRSQNGRVLWDRMRRLITRWLPIPIVCYPYPLRRMGVVT
jgi:hypothetical protein